MKIYKASFDTTTKILSTIIVGAILVIELSFLNHIGKAVAAGASLATFIGKLLPLLFLLGIVVFVFLFSVKHYGIEHNNTLVVQRWINKVVIPFAEIKSARVLKKEELGLVFRTFGVGGLFGYFGKFRSAKLGAITYYATQSKNRVLVELNNGKKILITPDDVSIADKLPK